MTYVMGATSNPLTDSRRAYLLAPIRSRREKPLTMTLSRYAILLGVTALSACSGDGLLSTGAITPAAPAAPPNDPPARAFQVGTTSARAVKCGFYFDPAKLRANYLASEQATGATPEDIAKLEKTYDAANAATAKVVATHEGYCSEDKTKYIKANLTRHLAGDFSPGPPDVKKEPEDEGIFSSGGSGSSAPEFKLPPLPGQ